MPRIPRIVAVGWPHHITQRGNYKQDIFLDDNDKLKYLSWVQEYSAKHGLSVIAYCLMRNHVHFVVIPEKEDSLAKAFNSIHMRYSHYFNKRLKATGHLWQGRFYSCVLDEQRLISVIKYVERNPVRANIVKKPWQWQWSSTMFHINGKEESPLIKLKNLFEIIADMSYDSWKEYIDSKDDKESLDNIRKHTLTGRPLANISFIEKLEKKFGRRLLALPEGRPKKKEK